MTVTKITEEMHNPMYRTKLILAQETSSFWPASSYKRRLLNGIITKLAVNILHITVLLMVLPYSYIFSIKKQGGP